MAKHIRQQVREAAKADMLGLPTTGPRVFSGRVAPIKPKDMPCWNMLLLDEAGEWDSVPNIARQGRLILEGRAFGDDLLDQLDTMAAEAETRIYSTTPQLDTLLQNIDVPTTQIDLPEPTEGNVDRVGVIRILFPVTYRTAISDPTTKV